MTWEQCDKVTMQHWQDVIFTQCDMDAMLLTECDMGTI